ncbi:DUF2953 domain-containing protein [Methanosarcina hadiensis]|uniref:DUF2953 domain-containing protein n=1 Tax=Methanosarcina hadiensis TaxID=3078083 RepID=UPI00397775BE
MLAIYLIILVFLLILFVLLTAIVLTFKLKVLSLEGNNELGGTFTVKWLFFSRTFLIGGPEEGKYPSEEMSTEVQNREIIAKTEEGKARSQQTEIREKDLDAEYYTQPGKVRKPIEEKPGEETIILEGKERIEVKKEAPVKKKRSIFDRIRRKKIVSEESEVEEKEGMTFKEKLHWGLEAYKALRKPLFRLLSDMLNAIKIRKLNADLTFGLQDPADTGMLCGLIHAFLGTVYSRCRSCSFSVCPVFMDSLLDFRGSAEIRVKLYSLIFPVIKFILNWKTLSFTYLIVKEKLRGSSKINS